MNQMKHLGIDIGGVLKDKGYVGEGEDASAYVKAPPMREAFETLRVLSQTGYQGKIWVISKAGPKYRHLLRQWLDFHHFYALTLIHKDRVHFVDDDAEKPMYAQKLRLTHFIDDKEGILQRLAEIGIKQLYLYKPRQTQAEIDYDLASKFTIVRSWRQVRSQLLRE